MSLRKFVKDVSETYFSEKDKSWNNSKRFWNFLFIGFFALYLFQIYTAYIDFNNQNLINPNEFWQTKLYAAYLQGIVLSGVFIRFASAQFRGKWFIRFGELGEFIGFAAFVRHLLWHFSSSAGDYCTASPSIIGLTQINSQLLTLYFLGWFIYKTFWLIAVIWKTVRK